jgi:hypothetical protein
MSRRWVDYENESYLRRWIRLLRWWVDASRFGGLFAVSGTNSGTNQALAGKKPQTSATCHQS